MADHGAIRAALEVTLASDPVLLDDKHAALLSLCRLIASQLDEAGEDAASRLTAAYLSALKDVQRAIGDDKKGSTGGKLAQLKALNGGQGTGRTARRSAAG